ncbi:ATP-dependent helicase [Butyrivibrio sp. DSM 10294]|uniref:ATP-dependent helicase n=1 Tax=Butyrivibrio sp. DSM 10294 TaxID=2972457 RepID=UPI00234F24CC|nr:ATP-dependent helicase [Butyrivibrio sp. DSM 10294]MDC7295203.1 ATP-dependent helicase [Butyrivibrio sp. DSM 10294]
MKNNNPSRNGVMGNAAQMDAIMHHKGPAIVIAGPGSGKTFVIVQRLKYLIEVKKEDPAKILVITFTKAAALEMQQRFYKLTDSSYPEVNFGTFHSVFYQIIRQNKSNKEKFSIADENFKNRLIRDILGEPGIKDILVRNKIDIKNISDEDIKDIITDISRVKNTGIDPANANALNICKDAFSDIFDLYNKRLLEFGKIDFDDMICRCLELLQSDSEVLDYWQKRFSFYLVDEYQDINSIQFKILRLLSKLCGNVFAVGDDDQSIYGFRGSDPGIMLSFEESFREYSPVRIILKQNYRCGRKIIENACLLINDNSIRFKKDITAGTDNGDGYVITRRFKDKAAQYKAIATYLGSGEVELSRVAVIYRTNQEAMLLAANLKDYGIATNLDSVCKTYIEDEAVGLVLSYISFACNGHKRSYFLKIMNKPMRFISRDACDSDTISEKKILDYYMGNTAKQKDIKRLFVQINMVAHLRPSLAVRYIRRDIGVEKLYPSSAEALDKLLDKAKSYEYSEEFLKALALELENSRNNSAKQKKNINNGNCVKLLTMHGAKGLEFDVVWLPDLNEGIIPSRGAETKQQIEEERRMLYVGMTRAKSALIMSYIAGTEDNPMLPSRFLRPIRHLWEKKENHSSPSSPSSGSSMISSNSTSSR